MTPSQRLEELEKNVASATAIVQLLMTERGKLNRDLRRAQEVCALACSELDMYRRYLIREGTHGISEVEPLRRSA